MGWGGACLGFEALTAMEKVPTDGEDRPRREIKITGATVFVNPFKDEEEAERKAAEEARLKVHLPLCCFACITPPGSGGGGRTPSLQEPHPCKNPIPPATCAAPVCCPVRFLRAAGMPHACWSVSLSSLRTGAAHWCASHRGV